MTTPVRSFQNAFGSVTLIQVGAEYFTLIGCVAGYPINEAGLERREAKQEYNRTVRELKSISGKGAQS